jgi:subtilisin family serine protease
MSTLRPAYSDAFEPEAIRQLHPTLPLDGITPDWAWGESTGRGVKVAVIDSGIEADHPAVGGNVSGYVAIREGADGLEYDSRPHDDMYGHGTACAGIIGSLAPEWELYSVRVLGAALSGRAVVFAAGLRWAIEHGMDVCNLSLGTPKKDYYGLLHELADLAYFRNVMLVTAANNQPVPSFPSVYASVVSVAATEDKDPYRYYFNPSPPVEFGAPGIDVRVAWRDGGWLNSTGNSFAAPHISGLIARMLAKHPHLTVFQVKTILRALAANVAQPAPDTV